MSGVGASAGASARLGTGGAGGPSASAGGSGAAVAPGIRRMRVVLIALGVALLGVGGVVLLRDVAPIEYPGILLWFAGALVLHDAIVAPAVFGIALALRKAGRRMPGAVIALVQGALVVGALIAAIVLPEIYRKSLGTRNDTVLPLDYAGNLIVFAVALAVLTVLTCAGYLVAQRMSRPGRGA
jgi:hypothetical protein